MAGDPGEDISALPEDTIFQERVRPSKADLYRALIVNEGNLSKTAREFGVRRGTVYEMVNSTPELISLMAEFREEQIDGAEDNIFAEVKKGSESASRFVLGTLGKKRGWAQGVEGSGKDGAITIEITKFSEGPVNGSN